MPSAAAAFWAGLLLWQVRPAAFGPWAWAALGVGALVGAWVAAAPPRRDRSPIDSARLAAREPPSVAALAGEAPPVRRGGLGAAALTLLGLLLLAMAWAGFADARLDGSLLARLGSTRIEATGRSGRIRRSGASAGTRS